MTFIKNILSGAWSFLRGLQQAFSTLIFTFLLIILLIFIVADTEPRVPNGAAYIFNPVGFVVEQVREKDTLEIIFSDQDNTPPEVRMRDIIRSVESAKTDDRISHLVLDIDSLYPSGPANAHQIAELIIDFKTSGKPVYAYGMGYTQAQYLIASQADRVMMHPQGAILLTGYGLYPTYMKRGIEMIGAEFNVFRIGDYKSAGDPYMFDDMPAETRESNGALITTLWQNYIQQVSRGRGFEDGYLAERINNITQDFEAAEGKFGAYAINTGLVDELMTSDQWDDFLIDKLEENSANRGYKEIGFDRYLAATEEDTNFSSNKIAVVIAEGTILDGEQPAGFAGGDTVARHLREARNDDDVKAIVLLIDSPGGSSFASDIIRNEVDMVRASGKPIIASMSNYAASGGYWIAAKADTIFAHRSTITGSIGIIAVIPNFDGTLDKLGLNTDGVGTTSLSSSFNPGMPLANDTRTLINLSIESGYRDFLRLVSEGRGMETSAVDAIAQGRVWAGETAKENGLVDNFGTLTHAIAAAAKRANLNDYSVEYVEDGPNLQNLFFEYLFANEPSFEMEQRMSQSRSLDYFQSLFADAKGLMALNDPMNIYAICLACKVQ